MGIRSRIVNNPIGPAVVPLTAMVAAMIAAVVSRVAGDVTILRVAGIVACLSFAMCLVAMRSLSRAPRSETVEERIPRNVFATVVVLGVLAMLALSLRIATADAAWVLEHVAS